MQTETGERVTVRLSPPQVEALDELAGAHFGGSRSAALRCDRLDSEVPCSWDSAQEQGFPTDGASRDRTGDLLLANLRPGVA